MTQPRSVDVGLLTSRPGEMLTFYTEVLGLRKVARVDTTLGPMEVLVFGTSKVKIVGQEEGALTGAASRQYLTFETDDLAALWERLTQAGATTVSAPTPVVGAGIVAMVRDPDGSLVELIERQASASAPSSGQA